MEDNSVTLSETMDDTPFHFIIHFQGLPQSIYEDVRKLSEGFSAKQFLKFIFKSRDSLKVYHDDSVSQLYPSYFQLGVFCALTLSSRTPSVRITEQWENVLWEIVDLALYWRDEIKKDLMSWVMYQATLKVFEYTTNTLKSWILKIFSDPELCPNPYLRLQMLHLIGIWSLSVLKDETSGMQAAAGLVANRNYMNIVYLMPDLKYINLFTYLGYFLRSLDFNGYLATIAAAAVEQLRRINVGPELSLLFNIVQVFSQMALHSVVIKKQKRLILLENAWYLYSFVLNDLQTTREAYGAHGLAKVAADTLLTITSCILKIGSTLPDKNESRFTRLMINLNLFYKTISGNEAMRRSIYQVLRLDHPEYLSFLVKKAEDSGIVFHHFLDDEKLRCQKSSDVVPEEFRDSVTQTLMEAPVLLHSSKMVIDESTLLRLLLESQPDPFTRLPLDDGSYSRLPELQADILVWKKSYGII